MQRILEVKALKKYYSVKKKIVKAVDGISFEGFKGEILGILGPNGSGKTTVIKSITTIVDHDDGEINILGVNNKTNRKKVLNNISAVLEGARNIYWRLSPEENIRYFAGLRGFSTNEIKYRMEYLLDILDLQSVRNKQIGEFSRGMQQKVAIACAFITSPEMVLLDEPTLGLDVETARNMKKWIIEIIRRDKIFLLVTSHDMKFIESICDRVIIIKNGTIVASDYVSNLKSVFLKKVFKITTAEKLSASQLSLIQNDNNLLIRKNVVTTPEGEVTELFFNLTKSSEIYHVFDILKQNKQEIISVDILQNDFEDIFVDIIKNGVTNK
ncbi:MAG: ABC transporter ATP-binding protein [Oligoflexia bacterium]|nr:ABC transporter ATP-binding protein [Oligoflexia bacterium]